MSSQASVTELKTRFFIVKENIGSFCCVGHLQTIYKDCTDVGRVGVVYNKCIESLHFVHEVKSTASTDYFLSTAFATVESSSTSIYYKKMFSRG